MRFWCFRLTGHLSRHQVLVRISGGGVTYGIIPVNSLSLGNIIGANFFNIVLVSVMAITISPFGVPKDNAVAGINTSLLVDIPVMFFVMAVMTVPTLIRGKMSRAQGILLILTYAAFCAFRFVF